MTLHPTKEEAYMLVDELIEEGSCLACRYPDSDISCRGCIARVTRIPGELHCVRLTTNEKLLGFAFIITMPASIRKSLEEGVEYEM